MAKAAPTGIVTQEAVPNLKRALGVWDLTFLCVVAIANLNVVPVIAASGPATVWLWAAALLFFFLPQGIAVIELSKRMPAEGGIYVWTKEMFGDLHGFLCGWAYWTANMFFIPTLLFYLLGIATYSGGTAVARLGASPLFFGTLTIGLLWLTTIINIFGLGFGKWVNNAGGIGTAIAATVLILLGIWSVWTHGFSVSASSFAFAKLDGSVISTFGVICFGLVGLELGPVMGDEIRDPAKNIPRGTLYGGVIAGFIYVACTLVLLVAVPKSTLRVLQGVLQAVDGMTAGTNLRWILLALAVTVACSVIGSVSAWTGGSARILFVSGLDRYLPKMFGRIHPRYNTPHVALIGIATLSSLLIAISFVGQTSVKEAYITLLDLAVVLQMISYLYLYASLARVAFDPKTASPARSKFAAVSGFLTTAFGLVFAFVPSHQVESVWRFEIKMIVCTLLFLGVAAGLFLYYSRRRAPIVVLAAAQL
jgi:glutamate:GABA antiporter